MKIIQLDTVDSTNSFLKDLARISVIENFTTVVAKDQRKGRGQSEVGWLTDSGKNLTFSVFVSFLSLDVVHQKYLNYAISLAIIETLNSLGVLNLKIKWPNDILVGNDKISGILTENNLKNKKIQSTVIGIGLNVNQEMFPSFSRKATSLKRCLQSTFDLEDVLNSLLKNIKSKIAHLNANNFQLLESNYLDLLYKKNIPTTFKDRENVLFMGMIRGVSPEGKLQILLEDETLKEFGIKEVSFA